MTRGPRLPNSARTRRPAPGQLDLWARPTFVVLLPHGRSLSLLQGGRHAAPAPTPVAPAAQIRRAA